MTLSPGAKLGTYEILGLLGSGGMGEVYRAKDTRLHREVAIKVLPASVAGDRDRLARFEREAQVLASLNHPNIAQIYGLHESGDSRALVMELVAGRTVSVPLPMKTALFYARQIAEALEAAHEKGIAHRDLKPGNIMVTPDGVVKVLDFGLASTPGREPERPAADSATMTMTATQAGMILGTPPYMSPEQAAGKPVDRRADIWAFGVVLWEMLTGRRLFSGKTGAECLSQVLVAEIDFDQLPAETPPAIRELLRRCLDRDVKNRLRDIGEARYLLSRPLETLQEQARPTAAPAHRFSAVWLMVPVVALLAAAFGMYRLSTEPDPSSSQRLLPFATEDYGESKPFWSPDGRTIAYVATIDGKDQIFTRALSAASPFPIAKCPAICDVVGWSGDGSRVYYQSRTMHLDARVWSVGRSGGASAPVFKEDFAVLASAVSPDGKRLAMIKVFVNQQQQEKASLFISEPPGATPVRIEAFPVVSLTQPHWIAWFADSDRVLVFSAAIGSPTIFLVSASQKTLRTVARTPMLFGLTWSRDPRFAIATVRSSEAGASGLYWVDVNSGALSPLRLFELPIGPYDTVDMSPDGRTLAYTVASVDRDMMLIPLDGSAVRPLLATRLQEHGARYSPISDEFAYVGNNQIRIRQSRSMAERVVVSDADFPASAPRGDFRHPAFSPDGQRIAYNKQFKIWISPANGGQAVPLNTGGGEFGAEWSPDGMWIAYNSARPKGPGLFKQRVGSNEDPVRLTNELCGAGPAWSPDGAWIACSFEATGMSLVPASGGPPKSLGKGYEPHAVWARDSDHLYVIRDSGEERVVGSLAWRTGKFQPLTHLPADFVISGSGAYAGRMSLSYDGRALLATVDRATGDIWLLNGVHPPESFWRRMFGRHSTEAAPAGFEVPSR